MKIPVHFRIELINGILIIFICQLSCFVKPQNTTHFGNAVDRKALLELKTYLTGTPDETLSSWNDSLNICQWKGVTCGRRHQRVTGLSLGSMQLSGFLPPAIGNLSFLDTIDLSYNKLHGSIPKEIGRLSRLVELDLSSNLIEGGIPADLMNCTNLERIDFSRNNITGSLPFQVGFFLKLSAFWVKENQFTGGIPSSLGNISTLRSLSFSGNHFQGSIPDELGLLKNLTLLQFFDNNLSGTVPLTLFNSSSIIELTLSQNQLYGNLPSNMGSSLPNLQYFTISRNQFTGTIPESISNISSLQKFDVSYNNLTGQVPNNLGVLKNLTRLSVGHNGLGRQRSGDLQFLDSLANASSLSELILVSNSFGGPFPISLFNMTQLTRLLLGTNAISDHIPDAIGNLNNLIELGIEQNDLIETIPSSISQLQKLQGLTLGSNKLSGPVTFFSTNLSRLCRLGLENNRLNGSIPSAISNCSGLQTLDLSQNQFTSLIPESVIGGLQQLTYLDLHQNSFSGSFPLEIGNLKNLNKLLVSDNRFSGSIPNQLGKCFALEHLDMSRNYFEGGIPLSFGSFKGVSFLDLSHNNLSGAIPACLQDLPVLQNLNLSFNNLQGSVPNKGIFSNVSRFSIQGNKKLCGGISQLYLPPCSMQLGRSSSLSHSKWLVGTLCVFLAIVILLASCLCIFWDKVTRKRFSITSSFALTYGNRLSYKLLLDATNGFSPSNLIGSGSFGSVYKATIPEEERPVAVKVLNLKRRGASRSFMSECGALGRIRHRNLLKILTTCSGVDLKGDRFLALVFEYMTNGSLERWLHESGNLSFRQRLIIAIDVASALEYLHHDCETSIVHCDLKPGNVLLDEDMVARVGDFGLARLLCESEVGARSEGGHTSFSGTIGTVGYVAPEYGTGGKVSTQGDVYSYGILLLEIFTGKRPTSEVFKNGETLHNYVKTALPTQPKHIADKCLLKEFRRANNITSPQGQDMEAELLICLAAIAGIGVACSVESPSRRLSIRDALVQLRTIQKVVHKLYESEEDIECKQ